MSESIVNLQRQIDDLQAELDAHIASYPSNQQALQVRVGKAVDGGETYPASGQQFHCEFQEIDFPESTGQQTETLTKRQTDTKIVRNLAGTIPEENSTIWAFLWKRKWLTFLGGAASRAGGMKIGKTATNVERGQQVIVNIWRRANGLNGLPQETDPLETQIAVYDWMAGDGPEDQISQNKEVLIKEFVDEQVWRIIAAECE